MVLFWVLCSMALQTRAKPYRSQWGSVLFLWSPYENALRQLAFEVLETVTQASSHLAIEESRLLFIDGTWYMSVHGCAVAQDTEEAKKFSRLGLGLFLTSCKMPPWCVFLLQEVMLSQPKHRTAQRLRWVFSCPGQAEAWGWMESLLHVRVGKHPLALGEGPRLPSSPKFIPPRRFSSNLSPAAGERSLSGRVVHPDLYPRGLICALSPASGVPGK